MSGAATRERPDREAADRPGAGRVRSALRSRACIAFQTVLHLVPLLTVLMAASEWNGIPGQPLRDTSSYYLAAQAAGGGGDIYDPVPPPGPHEYEWQHYYLYPPPLAALLSLLPDMSLTTFDRLWLCLNVIAFWVFAASLARIAHGHWTLQSTLRWGAATFFIPSTWLIMRFGNIELIILALVAAGLAHRRLTGALLALAAVFKVTPVWAFVVRAVRDPGIGRSAAVALAGCTAVCFAVFGIAETFVLSFRWVREVMPAVSQGQFWGGSLEMLRAGLDPVHYTSNLSLSFLPVQLAVLNGWWDYAGGELPGPVRLYLTVVAILGPLLAAWLTRRRGATLQTAVVFAAAVFAAPIVRPYVLPVLLLVLAAARSERRTAALSAPRA